MPVFVGKRITVEKQSDVTRSYACAKCGYRTEVSMAVRARGVADGSIVRPAHQIQAEAAERADAALANEVQDMLDLVPCPRCGGRSENAALYRQNSVLAVIGWVFAGAGMGVFASLPALDPRGDHDGAIRGLVFWTAAGIAVAAVTWFHRQRRIARAARLLSEEAGAAPVEKRVRSRSWSAGDLLPWHVNHPRAGMHVFRDAEEMSRVWSEHGGAPGGMPRVDFDLHMVVEVFEQEGSYKEARAIQHVYKRGRELRVIVARHGRPWSMINPASVIRVPRVDGEPVFLDAESPEAKRYLRSLGE